MSSNPITVFLEESWQGIKQMRIKSVPNIFTAFSLSLVTYSSSHPVLHGLIDPVDQPGEGLSIDGFSQGISGIDGMIDCERAEDLYRETKS